MALLATINSSKKSDAQKSCKSMISRWMSRVFCDLCSQKTPRGQWSWDNNEKSNDVIVNKTEVCYNRKISRHIGCEYKQTGEDG